MIVQLWVSLGKLLDVFIFISNPGSCILPILEYVQIIFTFLYIIEANKSVLKYHCIPVANHIVVNSYTLAQGPGIYLGNESWGNFQNQIAKYYNGKHLISYIYPKSSIGSSPRFIGLTLFLCCQVFIAIIWLFVKK